MSPQLRLLEEDEEGLRPWEAYLSVGGQIYQGRGDTPLDAVVNLCELMAEDLV